jgi:hypothetical protein
MPHLESHDDAHYLDGVRLEPGCRIEWFDGERWKLGKYMRAVDGSAWIQGGAWAKRLGAEDEVRCAEPH